MGKTYLSAYFISETTERVSINSGIEAQNKVLEADFILFWIGQTLLSLPHIELKSIFYYKFSLKKKLFVLKVPTYNISQYKSNYNLQFNAVCTVHHVSMCR